MKRIALLALWLGTMSIASLAQAPQKPAAGPLVDGTRLVMQPDQVTPGDATANVFGDPGRPGTFVQRLQLAPNTRTRPHFYDRDRWVTVLKGTWWVGQGAVFNAAGLMPIREGGFMYQPANLRTFDVAGDTGVVLQISGNGPIKSTHAEVDANGVSVPPGGPYPEDRAAEGRGRGRGGRRGQPPPQPQQ